MHQRDHPRLVLPNRGACFVPLALDELAGGILILLVAAGGATAGLIASESKVFSVAVLLLVIALGLFDRRPRIDADRLCAAVESPGEGTVESPLRTFARSLPITILACATITGTFVVDQDVFPVAVAAYWAALASKRLLLAREYFAWESKHEVVVLSTRHPENRGELGLFIKHKPLASRAKRRSDERL